MESPSSGHFRETSKIQPVQKKNNSNQSKFHQKPQSLFSQSSSEEEKEKSEPSSRNNQELELTHEVLFYSKEMIVAKSSADSA